MNVSYFKVAEILVVLIYKRVLKLPFTYKKFIPFQTENSLLPIFCDLIEIQFNNVENLPFDSMITQLTSEPSWQLGLDQEGRYIFHFTTPLPERIIVMDPNFSSGTLYVDQSVSSVHEYLLNTADIIIFSNRLANQGDLLLHAGGVSINGQGYVFVGRSGVGKSTLVDNLAENNSVTVLGEDQVVLRYLDGVYWIFGTPWHLNPDRCSPMGVPLKKIFFLDRKAANIVSSVSPKDGFKRLMQTAFIPYYRPAQVELIMENLERLGTQIPYKLLAYHLGDDILKIIIEP